MHSKTKEGKKVILGKGHNKAQTWSFDILMAVFVFLLILVLFFGIISSLSEPRKGKLSKDAELLTKALTGRSDTSIVEENKLQEKKVSELVNNPIKYDELKKELGIKGDFCIYFEDSNGNLVPVIVDDGGTPNDPTDDKYVNGVGSGDATINDVRCGAIYTQTNK
ncbi:MAG: hypothetical protein N3D84_03995 [Candidatus Woesearchaeota archaeon]|nr:hypothetical protein [Candidatus Woesearchaeota archaeon]